MDPNNIQIDSPSIISCPHCKKNHKVVVFHEEDLFVCPNTQQIFSVHASLPWYAKPADISSTKVQMEGKLFPFQSKSQEAQNDRTPVLLPPKTVMKNLTSEVSESTESFDVEEIKKPRLGKYEVEGVLGGGGFGIVYKAYDTVLRRNVAIKKSNNPLEADRIELFKKEAEILAQLNHPNIIQVYDFNVDEEQIPYIVIEFISGEHLGNYLKRMRFEEKTREDFVLTICHFFAELADALSFLHEKKIYHQDLKPKNILVCQETSRVKLLDFGLASMGDQEISHFEGTCRYCAPERFEKGYKPTITSDIYSLGLVFFQALTGRAGIPGETIPQIIGNILSGRNEIAFQPGEVPEPLKKICLKATHFDASQRYQHASELHFDLASYIAEVTRVNDYPYLYLLDERRGRILFPLSQNKYYVGRSFGNDLVIQDDTLSRIHALFRIHQEQVTLTNISKTSPIFVNKLTLRYNHTVTLQQNDIIRISHYVFFYVPAKKGHDPSESNHESLIPLEQAKLILSTTGEELDQLIRQGELSDIRTGESRLIDSRSLHRYIEKTSGNKMFLNEDEEAVSQAVVLTIISEFPPSERVYEFDATHDAITIGRSPNCLVVIESSDISRLHCRIEKQLSGEYLLLDMGSSNGTYVNQRRVQKHIIVDGEEIQLSKFRIRFQRSKVSPKEQNSEGRETIYGKKSSFFNIEEEMEAESTITKRLSKTQAPEVDVYLAISSPEKLTSYVPLERNYFIFGSDASCDFCIEGIEIEAKHAVLIRESSGFRLLNLRTKSGVLLNNQITNNGVLFNGDCFKIGNYEYRFCFGTPPVLKTEGA